MTNCKRYTEQELQMLLSKRYTEQELQQLLSDGIAELQRENAELKKDKARLDWLADVNNTIGAITLPRDIVLRNLHSLRTAIDEAMAVDDLGRGK